MGKIAMEDVQIKLEQIEASLQIVLEGLDGDLAAVQQSDGDNAKFISVCTCQRANAVYSPALSLIHESIRNLKSRVDEAAE